MHERKLRKANTEGTLVINIPIELQDYMGLKEGDSVYLRDELGKKGKYLAVWKK